MNNRKKYKILIVDDQVINIMSLAKILKSDYDVMIAADGITAIEIAENHPPDIILLDIIMPGMNGFDVLSKLQNSDLTKDIPVIFITGLDNTEDEEKGLNLGAVDYITKPFQSSIVRARVRTHLKIVGYVRTIERLCMIDTLTELPNRRSFDNKIHAEWGRAVRESLPISVFIIDVDNFKVYNDTYGHPQGDLLLQTAADVFRQTLKRTADFAARWGGEEFIVLLPGTNLKGALTVAEQVRINIEKTAIPCVDGTDTFITVSIGVNSQIPSVKDTISNFITLADKALYNAKNSGRNQVCSHNSKLKSC